MDISDDEPEFRTFADAKEDFKERSIANPTIAKRKKKKITRVRKTGEQEAPKRDKPAVKSINPELLDIINAELSTAKVKEAAKEIVKNENQLEKLRDKGETKKIIIEKDPQIQKKVVSNIEVVFVKESYQPKGDAEAALKAADFRNKMFGRSNFQRVPLAKILKR